MQSINKTTYIQVNTFIWLGMSSLLFLSILRAIFFLVRQIIFPFPFVRLQIYKACLHAPCWILIKFTVKGDNCWRKKKKTRTITLQLTSSQKKNFPQWQMVGSTSLSTALSEAELITRKCVYPTIFDLGHVLSTAMFYSSEKSDPALFFIQ